MAETITLDFEVAPGPDGKVGTADDGPMPTLGWIRDEYASMGVHFTQGTVGQGSHFDGNAGNHFITSTSPIGYFTRPVFGISIESYSLWNATLRVYDAAGELLASDSILNNSGVFRRDWLSVATTSPIHGFSILADRDGPILNLDNMVLVTAVPELAGVSMLLAGLGGLGLTALRRRRPQTGA